jgi:acetyl-CoA C-acetyltransferase
VARRYDISRIEQDEFAVESQRRAGTDAARAAYAEEINSGGGRRAPPMVVTEDEHPRPSITLDALGGWQPSSRQGGGGVETHALLRGSHAVAGPRARS